MRDWVADDLERLAGRLWLLAERIRPTYKGPVCPDCQYAPDPGPDGNCPECAARWEQQRVEQSVYDGGYVDGYSEAAAHYSEP